MMQLMPNNRSCLKLHYYLYNFIWSHSEENMRTTTRTVMPICCIIRSYLYTYRKLFKQAIIIYKWIQFDLLMWVTFMWSEVWNISLSIIDCRIWYRHIEWVSCLASQMAKVFCHLNLSWGKLIGKVWLDKPKQSGGSNQYNRTLRLN